jgi:carboxymethylenebutenolidase
MDIRVIDLYNDYVHGSMPRREFLSRLATIAGSAVAASALLPLLEPGYAQAQQVAGDDERLRTGYVTYAGAQGPVRAYLARPVAASGKLPGVLVIHENRGLNAHIEDVARRTALAGHLALAPDGLSVAGGAPADQEAARDLFGKTDRAVIDADVLGGIPYLAAHPDCSGKIGTVGFCYGGGIALQGAVQHASVAAAVCFYGSAPTPEQVARIKAPLLLHYAGNDARINDGIDAFRDALDAHAVAYSLNASAARYDRAAATLAWERTLAFFATYLT